MKITQNQRLFISRFFQMYFVEGLWTTILAKLVEVGKRIEGIENFKLIVNEAQIIMSISIIKGVHHFKRWLGLRLKSDVMAGIFVLKFKQNIGGRKLADDIIHGGNSKAIREIVFDDSLCEMAVSRSRARECINFHLIF